MRQQRTILKWRFWRLTLRLSWTVPRLKLRDVSWYPATIPPGANGGYFYRPGQLMIRQRNMKEVLETLGGLGVCVLLQPPEHPLPGAVRVRIDSKLSVPQVLETLHRCGGHGPEAVGPNHVFWPMDPPVIMSGWPWYSGGGSQGPVEAHDPPAQNGGSRGENITIAVFDSGLVEDYYDENDPARSWLTEVDPSRPAGQDGSPDIEGQGGDPDSDGLDYFDSHATFIAGIIKRAAPEANVIVRNVLSEAGDVDDATLSSAVDAVLNGDQNVRLVNLSLGGTTYENEQPIGLAEMVNRHQEPDHRVLFVAAAGNNGQQGDPMWPAALDGVVGVGALDGDAKASFSNVFSADVWAPGVDVVSAFGRGILTTPGYQQEFTTGLATWSGTSFAAPLVTAVLCDYISTDGVQMSAEEAIEWLDTHPSQDGVMVFHT
ncbi:MAG TPA: S8/S53 family peptidase [Candidatus Limnocylindrales bacterium]|nr:S8/S53 family peptidase [Candidatus Limnocylindrales bacterium]